jgi:uncharacterized protein
MKRTLLAMVFLTAGITSATVPLSPAVAQSWCGTPRNCTEEVICATPQLGALDEEMSELYYELRDQSSRRGAHALLQSQRGWLAARDTCGCNANCLVGYYRSRISQFKSILY